MNSDSQLLRDPSDERETIIHAEPARFFDVPIQGPLPEELNFIV